MKCAVTSAGVEGLTTNQYVGGSNPHGAPLLADCKIGLKLADKHVAPRERLFYCLGEKGHFEGSKTHSSLTLRSSAFLRGPQAALFEGRQALLYLSNMLGNPVYDSTGEKLGVVSDLAISTGEMFPRITSLAFKGPGRTPFMISWRKYVDSFSEEEVRLNTESYNIRFSYLQPDEVLLARDFARPANRRHTRPQTRAR